MTSFHTVFIKLLTMCTSWFMFRQIYHYFIQRFTYTTKPYGRPIHSPFSSSFLSIRSVRPHYMNLCRTWIQIPFLNHSNFSTASAASFKYNSCSSELLSFPAPLLKAFDSFKSSIFSQKSYCYVRHHETINSSLSLTIF